MTWGSRFADGGYQAPRTNSAALERGQPVRSLRWTRNHGTLEISLELVPLLHGRPELFEIAYQWNDTARKSNVYVPCTIRGESWAREAFAATAAALDRGELPDAVLTAPGTPLGP